MRLLSAEQIREVDRLAIEEWGVPGVVLMENAGTGATQLLRETLEAQTQKGPIAIFTGAGNNAGDGFVIARHLLNKGHEVWTFLCSPKEKLKGDALINFNILEKMTEALFVCEQRDHLDPWLERLSHCSAILDALLGTGMNKDLSGWWLDLIDLLNQLEAPLKVAIDIPTGLDALSGQPRPRCFQADLTTTFAFAKVGLVMPSAIPAVGRLEIVDIGAPAPVMEQIEHVCVYQREEPLKRQWPGHPHNSHKGTFGHLLVVAGAPGKTGAAHLSSQAALRSGAGLCTLAAEEETFQQLQGGVLEVMCESLGTSQDAPQQVLSLLPGKQAVLFGPGLGQSEPKAALLTSLLIHCEVPLVIDADGLNLVARHRDMLLERQAPTILTPHPGEMARLVGTSAKEIQEKRLEQARAFATQFGVHLVLKGAQTVIAAPDGELWINPTGNPGLATAGSGDVLAGILSALLARQMPCSYAARVAPFLHGKIADTLVATHGYSGIIASDLIKHLPAQLAAWETD